MYVYGFCSSNCRTKGRSSEQAVYHFKLTRPRGAHIANRLLSEEGQTASDPNLQLWKVECKEDLKTTMEHSISLPKGLYQNISFVYRCASFVLHMASKGDKVRVTRSTLGRNRKCCCEHQLLLRSSQALRGLGLPRRCQIKRLLGGARHFESQIFTYQRC